MRNLMNHERNTLRKGGRTRTDGLIMVSFGITGGGSPLHATPPVMRFLQHYGKALRGGTLEQNTTYLAYCSSSIYNNNNNSRREAAGLLNVRSQKHFVRPCVRRNYFVGDS